MRILIVGGAGYVGSALIPALLERGYEVDVVDVKWFGVHLPDGSLGRRQGHPQPARPTTSKATIR